jgi:hypothetical protein
MNSRPSGSEPSLQLIHRSQLSPQYDPDSDPQSPPNHHPPIPTSEEISRAALAKGFEELLEVPRQPASELDVFFEALSRHLEVNWVKYLVVAVLYGISMWAFAELLR